MEVPGIPDSVPRAPTAEETRSNMTFTVPVI